MKKGLPGWTGRPSLRQALASVLVKISYPRQDFHGLRLYFSAASRPRIVAALELVRESDPLRWGRLPRYMPVLIESDIGTHFSTFFGAAFIDLEKTNDWRLAGCIVHELTHAYLFARWRLRYEGELRLAHERICQLEETRLYRRMIRALDCDPIDGERFIAQVKARHRRALEYRGWERPKMERFIKDWRRYVRRASRK